MAALVFQSRGQTPTPIFSSRLGFDQSWLQREARLTAAALGEIRFDFGGDDIAASIRGSLERS
ncbi:hypothetical protein HO173_012287 [Letharia columbiana]|uniref:Uncharacterized protein n=1 Tax=Letharia columbiana TaxID=112416 RepID=A0A8H6CNM3_9LECA|nr:uncharacterized protein HO173_012287 [Letharia columbiana]KAF6226783.1 hypothetical protein HO173_012287 [Letharia columbiana]